MGSKSIIDLAIFDLGGTVCDGIDEATGLANIGPINALKFSLKEVWDIDPGFDVILPPKRCCGRPMISKGMLNEATQNARHNISWLLPYAQKGLSSIDHLEHRQDELF